MIQRTSRRPRPNDSSAVAVEAAAKYTVALLTFCHFDRREKFFLQPNERFP